MYWNFVGFHGDHSLYFFSTIQKASDECLHPFFVEIFSISAWEISKQRTAVIFRESPATFQSWKNCFIDTAKLHLYRLNPTLRDSLSS
uniref:Uncharacterized protein n=1 Tax=Arundo donax TaxID=35708 RepID=A0A0A9GQ64_ARUDO